MFLAFPSCVPFFDADAVDVVVVDVDVEAISFCLNWSAKKHKRVKNEKKRLLQF